MADRWNAAGDGKGEAPSWRAKSRCCGAVAAAVHDQRRWDRAERASAVEVLRKDVYHPFAPHFEAGVEDREGLDRNEIVIERHRRVCARTPRGARHQWQPRERRQWLSQPRVWVVSSKWGTCGQEIPDLAAEANRASGSLASALVIASLIRRGTSGRSWISGVAVRVNCAAATACGVTPANGGFPASIS